jgi:hypothetical protein
MVRLSVGGGVLEHTKGVIVGLEVGGFGMKMGYFWNVDGLVLPYGFLVGRKRVGLFVNSNLRCGSSSALSSFVLWCILAMHFSCRKEDIKIDLRDDQFVILLHKVSQLKSSQESALPVVTRRVHMERQKLVNFMIYEVC